MYNGENIRKTFGFSLISQMESGGREGGAGRKRGTPRRRVGGGGSGGRTVAALFQEEMDQGGGGIGAEPASGIGEAVVETGMVNGRQGIGFGQAFGIRVRPLFPSSPFSFSFFKRRGEKRMGCRGARREGRERGGLMSAAPIWEEGGLAGLLTLGRQVRRWSGCYFFAMTENFV